MIKRFVAPMLHVQATINSQFPTRSSWAIGMQERRGEGRRVRGDKEESERRRVKERGSNSML